MNQLNQIMSLLKEVQSELATLKYLYVVGGVLMVYAAKIMYNVERSLSMLVKAQQQLNDKIQKG